MWAWFYCIIVFETILGICFYPLIVWSTAKKQSKNKLSTVMLTQICFLFHTHAQHLIFNRLEPCLKPVVDGEIYCLQHMEHSGKETKHCVEYTGKIQWDYAMTKECVHCVGAKGCVNSVWINPKLFRFFVWCVEGGWLNIKKKTDIGCYITGDTRWSFR